MLQWSIILNNNSNSWLSSRIFFQGGVAKKFLGGAPSKFSGTNDSGGEGAKFFIKKMKFSDRVEISIISVFQYYSTIETYCKVHRID